VCLPITSKFIFFNLNVMIYGSYKDDLVATVNNIGSGVIRRLEVRLSPLTKLTILATNNGMIQQVSNSTL
jgi:hypothetical protein